MYSRPTGMWNSVPAGPAEPRAGGGGFRRREAQLTSRRSPGSHPDGGVVAAVGRHRASQRPVAKEASPSSWGQEHALLDTRHRQAGGRTAERAAADPSDRQDTPAPGREVGEWFSAD